MRARMAWLVPAMCAVLIPSGEAQEPAGRTHVPQIRVDFRELGFPPVDVIPRDESEIRALAAAPDGRIFGATSGRRSHLFVLDPDRGAVEPLGYLRGARVVHRSLVVSPSGSVYIGISIGIDNGGAGYEGFEGGRLLRYDPASDRNRSRIRIDDPCPVKDLGVMVAGEGIYALAMDAPRAVLYGLTYPGGYLFRRDIESATTAVLGRVAVDVAPGERHEHERSIGRALAIDSAGNVFTSGEGGYLYAVDARTRRLRRTDSRLPGVPGREVFNRVEAWVAGPQGSLYGATSDGYLFRLGPAEGLVENLGKPLNQYRVRGLVMGARGRIYGVGGDKDDVARLFSYDPARGVFEVLGIVDVDRRPFYAWRGFVFDSMAVGLDGIVYLGQAERGSKLFVYYPE
jgi:hypothetical protein